ncbi:Os06g0259850, partial [Oryza sativa Japonica Group]
HGEGRGSSASASTCFVCCSDELHFDASARAMAAHDALRPGQLYFVLPVSALHRPLSGQEPRTRPRPPSRPSRHSGPPPPPPAAVAAAACRRGARTRVPPASSGSRRLLEWRRYDEDQRRYEQFHLKKKTIWHAAKNQYKNCLNILYKYGLLYLQMWEHLIN